MGGSDRALMLGLPGLAVLAALALPTFRRSAAAAVDWFSMLFFTAGAAFIWLMYAAMQDRHAGQAGGQRRQAGAKIRPALRCCRSCWRWPALRRGSGSCAGAPAATAKALWKSLVLPAGGVTLCWLLAMTLWLQVLDFARSPRLWVQRIAAHVPADACAHRARQRPSWRRWSTSAAGASMRGAEEAVRCDYQIVITRAQPLPAPPPEFEEGRRGAAAHRPRGAHADLPPQAVGQAGFRSASGSLPAAHREPRVDEPPSGEVVSHALPQHRVRARALRHRLRASLRHKRPQPPATRRLRPAWRDYAGPLRHR
ncbi:MAG: hypothetical protein U1F67_06925 [Rubrivivax sp.]